MNRIEWDWYGTWVIDWLLEDCPWGRYDIWEKAYLSIHPEIEDMREQSYINHEGDGAGTTLDLIENHYHQSLIPLKESFVYAIFLILNGPIRLIRFLIEDCKSLVRRGKRRHQL